MEKKEEKEVLCVSRKIGDVGNTVRHDNCCQALRAYQEIVREIIRDKTSGCFKEMGASRGVG